MIELRRQVLEEFAEAQAPIRDQVRTSWSRHWPSPAVDRREIKRARRARHRRRERQAIDRLRAARAIGEAIAAAGGFSWST
jgi:hypothetical protein